MDLNSLNSMFAAISVRLNHSALSEEDSEEYLARWKAITDEVEKLQQSSKNLLDDVKKTITQHQKEELDLPKHIAATEEQRRKIKEGFLNLRKQGHPLVTEIEDFLDKQSTLLLSLENGDFLTANDSQIEAINKYLSDIVTTQNPRLDSGIQVLSMLEEKANAHPLRLEEQRPEFPLAVMELAETIDANIRRIRSLRPEKIHAEIANLKQLWDDVEQLRTKLQEPFSPELESQWQQDRIQCIYAVNAADQSIKASRTYLMPGQQVPEILVNLQIESQDRLIACVKPYILSHSLQLLSTYVTLNEGNKSKASLEKWVRAIVKTEPLKRATAETPLSMDVARYHVYIPTLMQLRERPSNERVEDLLTERSKVIRSPHETAVEIVDVLERSLEKSAQSHDVDPKRLAINSLLYRLNEIAERKFTENFDRYSDFSTRTVERSLVPEWEDDKDARRLQHPVLQEDEVKTAFEALSKLIIEVYRPHPQDLLDDVLKTLKIAYTRHNLLFAAHDVFGNKVESQHISLMPKDGRALKGFVNAQIKRLSRAPGKESEKKQKTKAVRFNQEKEAAIGPAGKLAVTSEKIDPTHVPKKISRGQKRALDDEELLTAKKTTFNENHKSHEEEANKRLGPALIVTKGKPRPVLAATASSPQTLEEFKQNAQLHRGTERVGRYYGNEGKGISPDFIGPDGTAYFKIGTVTPPGKIKGVQHVMYLTREDQGETPVQKGENYRIFIEGKPGSKKGKANISEVKKQKLDRKSTPIEKSPKRK